MLQNKDSVLVVEDDSFLSKVLVNRLKEEGLCVYNAYDGVSALAMCKEQKFKLILLDLLMPLMDGFDFLRNLRSRKNNTSVIVLTNLAQDDELEEAKKLGAEKCYIKSNIDIDDIVREVKERINN